MADRYWVGGTDSWDGTAGTKWATTSGGGGGASVPTSADDVFFSVLSTGTCTIATGNTGAKSIDCTGFTGTITGTAAISVAGSITLVAGQTYTHTGTVTLTGTGTLTTAGKTFSAVTVDGSGITVTLGDALNVSTRTLTITQGTFTTSASNYSVTAGVLSSSNSNVRTITLNGSTVTLTSGSGFDCGTSTNLTVNAGTSTINCIPSFGDSTFSGGGLTYYNVSIGGVNNETQRINGTNTYNNLTINNRVNNGTNRAIISANQTVNGTFTCNGTQTLPYRRYWIYSSVDGTNITITAAAISIFGTDFRNITGAGAASWTDSSRTGYWGDAGGNSGITFATGRNAYWNLAGTQLWTATAWALTNNGTPADANYPLVQDTAIFTEAGAAGTVQLTTQGLMIPTVTMADGVSNRTSAMTLNFGSGDRDNFFGSITFFSNLTISGGGARNIRLSGYSNTQSITTAGKTLLTNLELNESYNNTVQLLDDLTVTAARTTTVTTGTFNANGFNFSTGLFSSSNSNVRTITMGSGTWTLSGTGTVWNVNASINLTFNKDAANIVLSDTSTTARTFTGGSRTYNNLTIGGSTGTSTLTITGTNTFGTLASTKTVAHTIVFPNVTTTVSNWTITGTAGNVVTLSRTGASGTFTLAKSGGGVISGLDYLSISNSTASPINTWYAGANSTDGGGNTNWLFIAGPTDILGSASITANGTVTANGGLLIDGIAYVNGIATVTADGFYIADGVAAISAFANVTALGGGVLTGTAGITANGTVIANGVIQGEGWNPITPSSDTWTTITAGTETWTDISPSTDIWLRQG
jgi:hypothetical protein